MHEHRNPTGISTARSWPSCARGALSGAARALGLTQPTLARHVGQLEDALGGGGCSCAPARAAADRGGAEADAPARRGDGVVGRGAACGRRPGTEAALSGTVRIAASEVDRGRACCRRCWRDLRAAHPGAGVRGRAVKRRRRTCCGARRTSPCGWRGRRRRRWWRGACGSVELGAATRMPDYLARARHAGDGWRSWTGTTLIGFDRDRPAMAAAIAASGFPRCAGAASRFAPTTRSRSSPRSGRGAGSASARSGSRAHAGLVRLLARRGSPSALADVDRDARGPAREPALPRGLRCAGRRPLGADRLTSAVAALGAADAGLGELAARRPRPGRRGGVGIRRPSTSSSSKSSPPVIGAASASRTMTRWPRPMTRRGRLAGQGLACRGRGGNIRSRATRSAPARRRRSRRASRRAPKRAMPAIVPANSEPTRSAR